MGGGWLLAIMIILVNHEKENQITVINKIES
jgi:hypothetical protein